MLNHEGWCLMLILCTLIALLLSGLPHMRAVKSVEKRLAAEGHWLWKAASVVLCACGVLVLAVIPSAAYRGGVMRLLLPVSGALGMVATLCFVTPRIRKLSPHALTLCQAVAADRWTRVGLGVVSAAGALISAAACVSMVARMFAYVFSLHYMIALGAATGLVLMLTILCGADSRRSMDKLQIALLTALLAGTPVAALIASGNGKDMLQVSALSGGFGTVTIWDIAGDLCTGLGVTGMMLSAQTLFSERDPAVVRRSGAAASVGIAVLMLLAALAGFAACTAGIKLETITAAETVLTQIAELSSLPNPVSGLLSAALLSALLLYAQSALHFFGTTVAWDVVQPVTGWHTERPVVLMAEAAAVAACLLTFALARFPNTPLEWYVRSALLCGSVAGGLLVPFACGVKQSRTGQRTGLIAGCAVVLIIWLLPVPEKWKIVGILPALIGTVLPQLLIKDKA